MSTNKLLCGDKVMTKDEVINEFEKRERKLTVIFAVSFAIFGFTFLFNAITDAYINPTFPFLAGFALMFYGLNKVYRCPACNSAPRALGRAGIQISLKNCSNCGVKLR
ncbi:hypothetical protein K0J45_16325 [Shewanella alkalitolerans]|uniref:hypothetical protein n=1 Tax=Shewanella alkalitolerans TaxID=2864209 RepID=UPI001C6554F8|nr:hypothetical protein [Shewanella alkalitolerans]QYJ97061.1 hypothetical protein K0J45_16325 [Shewanella alkalitolerans]